MVDPRKALQASQLFNAGRDALQKGNFDYAINSLLKSTKLDPEKVLYRKALRTAEIKKYKDNKTGAKMAGVRTSTIKMRIAGAKARSKWEDMMNCAEDALAVNPWDEKCNYELAYACFELDMYETGIWVLESALEQNPKSADMFRLLAKYYKELKNFQRAINCLERAVRLDPGDRESGNEAKTLAADLAIQRGGFEEGKDFRSASESMVSKREQEVDEEPTLTPEQQMAEDIKALETKIKENKSDANAWMDVGELYRKAGHPDKAAARFKQAQQFCEAEAPRFKIKLIELQLEEPRKRHQEIQSMKKNARGEKLRQLEDKSKAFATEINKREIELYQAKIDYHPDDWAAWFEYGMCMLHINKFDHAIKALQQGRNDSKRRWEALMYLGYAFWKKKNYSLAEKNLSDALEAVSEANEEARLKIIYYRGRVYQDRGDIGSALDNYNDIAATDYGYKDVAKRLDELNAQLENA